MLQALGKALKLFLKRSITDLVRNHIKCLLNQRRQKKKDFKKGKKNKESSTERKGINPTT